MKSYAVIGLGRFGGAVARGLMAPDPETGRIVNEVIVVDIDENHIQDISDEVTYAVTADLRDSEVVRELNLNECDAAIVAIGSDISTSVLITLNLKEAGCPCVIAKATNESHRRILEKIGADRVIIPEHDFGIRLAQSLSGYNAYDLVALSDKYSIAQAPIPSSWLGKSLTELGLRAKYQINVLAIQPRGSDQIIVPPDPQKPLPLEGGSMTVLASQTVLRSLKKLR